jgi:phosphatidate cytidylyltransferase
VSGNLVRRVAFALVAIPVVIGAARLGGWVLVALLAAAAVLGAREIYDFAAAQGIAPLRRTGMLGAAAAPALMALDALGRAGQVPFRAGRYALAVWLLLVITLGLWRRGPGKRPLTSVAVTVFGALYAGWLPAFAILLRHPVAGPASGWRVGMALLCFPLVLTWVGDTAAFAGGTAIGGPKLAPLVSPNKTWSGAVAGLLGTVAAALIYAAVVFQRVGVAVGLGEVLVLGAAISVVGQLGDVAESLFKREVGVKDSSTLIPGHGGVLDRLDSLYFVLPVTALLFDAFRLT